MKIRNIFSLFFLLCFFGCNPYAEEQEYADRIIESVEKYRTENGNLPENLEKLGFEEKMDSPAFYRKDSDSTYVVWYGIAGVGNSMVYHSSTKIWKEEG